MLKVSILNICFQSMLFLLCGTPWCCCFGGTINVKNKYKVLSREPTAQRMLSRCLCSSPVTSDFSVHNIMPLYSLCHVISFVNKSEIRMLCQRDFTFLRDGLYELCHKNNQEKNVDFYKQTIPLQFISFPCHMHFYSSRSLNITSQTCIHT